MAVPKEFLKVERPKNTICKMIGDKCAVIERIGCKRINGNNVPINGKVIGHIINGKYVPKKHIKLEVTSLYYSDFILADRLSSSLLQEVYDIYGTKIGLQIYLIALLRTLNPGLSDYQIKDTYFESYMNIKYPDVTLGKTSISNLIEAIGKDYSKVLKFMQTRVEKIDDNNKIAIDGILSTNNSRINSLSEFSYKGRIKSSKDISQIIAFNTSTKEIICSLPYPGNTVDIVSFPDFINKVGIKSGVIITDKAGKRIDDIKNISYIHPLKRNLKLLEDLNMYDMEEKLNYKDKSILCKKVKYENKYYYAYLDITRASKEKSDFLRSNKSLAKYKKHEKKFGTVVYVSDTDLTLLEAYEMYKSRWEIELINKFYNSDWILTVREHNDYSVYGTEFINFLSSVIGNKMKNEFEQKGLLNTYTYGQIMKFLKRGKKIQDYRDTNTWIDTKQSEAGKKVLEILGI